MGSNFSPPPCRQSLHSVSESAAVADEHEDLKGIVRIKGVKMTKSSGRCLAYRQDAETPVSILSVVSDFSGRSQ